VLETGESLSSLIDFPRYRGEDHGGKGDHDGNARIEEANSVSIQGQAKRAKRPGTHSLPLHVLRLAVESDG
jgi:hypothetical protein